MCGMCSDTIAGCALTECGALPPVDENGKRRQFYVRWFKLGETPCAHVLVDHKPSCALATGSPLRLH
jgi:hypothetical protein